jgi:hypothetical protein
MKNKNHQKERYTRVCPKCKSFEVYMDASNPLQGSLGLPPLYICDKCKYSGVSFPEVQISELDDFKEKVKKKHLSKTKKDKSSLVDVSYGDFIVRFLWKISSPVTIIGGIIFLFLEVIIGIFLILLGIFMFYITYFKKRKLKD